MNNATIYNVINVILVTSETEERISTGYSCIVPRIGDTVIFEGDALKVVEVQIPVYATLGELRNENYIPSIRVFVAENKKEDN